MVSIRHCAHCVDFEVFVAANARSLLDWAPIRETWLRVVEPLITQVLHMVSVNMADSLRDFTPGHVSIQVKELLANLLHNFRT